MADQKRLPSYIYLPPDAVQRQAKLTADGLYDLLPDEILWRDRYNVLQRKGYQLRPRYHPQWTPSWTGTNLDPEFCEDFVVSNVSSAVQTLRMYAANSALQNPDVLDAVRVSDGSLVAMKTVKTGSQELQISQFLSSLHHPSNHCVPIVDVLEDPLSPSMSIMVMKYLRPWNDPEFTMVGDVIDFVVQMLEHGSSDIASPNVMMDGQVLYPRGHHPVWRNRSPDAIEDLVPLARIDHPVRYFFVDFGLSVRSRPGQSNLVVGDVGRDAEVPELSSTVPYDAFKADIYALGNFFDKELFEKYHRLEFLTALTKPMKQRQPALRPTANDLVASFERIRKSLDPSEFRWRLAPKSEPTYERFFNDTVAVAKNGLSHLRRFVQP
ncbi:hypothetical protein BN946_scf184791.g17 [Trametes cinnabarina]|uniref:Protein kinase domain-containing protein n=1 Tax=Pycnoporus cinnabarinus TaxID=5643 RepID=A0A060S4Q0_PYCCI|nr:hypothetical protein BN946_scf184791.g17 [Trametes cinnabarina]